MFGNTAQVAHSVARGLELAGYDTTIAEVSDAPSGLDPALDLLVVGAPTHAFSLSRPSTRADAVRQGAPAGLAEVGLREWLSSVPMPSAPPPIAVFDTRVSKVRRLPMTASRAAAKLARQRGLRLVADPAYFLVDDTPGPLLPEQLDRAVDWGRLVADALRASGDLTPA